MGVHDGPEYATTPFPGVYALVPVLGVVCLILFAGKETYAAKLLGTKLLVGIGLISYSAYLWHQPLFAFLRIATSHTAPLYLYGLLSALSGLMAYGSWKFIEQPFRKKTHFSRRAIFGGSLLGILICIFGGLYGHITQGFPHRFSNSELALVSPRGGDSSGCHNGLNEEQISEGLNCAVARKALASVGIAVVGDSHAAAITDALRDDLAATDQGFYAFNGAWCAPLLGFATNAKGRNDCIGEITEAYNQVIANEDIKHVVLFAQWANYQHGNRWDESHQAPYLFSSSGSFDWDTANVSGNLTNFRSAVEYTFNVLSKSKKEIVIVLPVPEYNFRVPERVNPRATLFDKSSLLLSSEQYFQRSSVVREVLISSAYQYNFRIIDPFDVFCSSGSCKPSGDRGAYYTDSNHLSYLGASLLTPLIVEALKGD